METSSPSHSKVELIVTNPDFGDFHDLNHYWTVGNPGATFALSMFSMVIPEGEKFFIRSVQAYKNEVTDTKLKKDIKAFIHQEAVHSKKHDEFNQKLKAQGYDLDAVEEKTRRFFEFIEKYCSKKTALAVTVFIEHITALGGEVEMRYPKLLEGSHPKAAEFWRWHAAEELEHKSVAFDLHSSVGGGYFSRMFAILVIMCLEPFFFYGVTFKLISGFRKREVNETPVTIKEIGSKNPKMYKELFVFARQYFFSYFKPSFHPWNTDSTAYLESWRKEKNYPRFSD